MIKLIPLLILYKYNSIIRNHNTIANTKFTNIILKNNIQITIILTAKCKLINVLYTRFFHWIIIKLIYKYNSIILSHNFGLSIITHLIG